MISFSIDKQRGQVNVEWMSRPVDSLKKSNKQSTARLGLDIHGAVTYFCFSTEKKLLRGLIFRGAYKNVSSIGAVRCNPKFSSSLYVWCQGQDLLSTGFCVLLNQHTIVGR